ncbi:acetylornithine deacetylase [Marinimicrobium sp. ABcell2]|uniref:acetylornithine deacetylase n=1 Tax=Marinimicrobium sp. ABcell2 TaxID=3069751 RepID=UPI0027B1924D|nr:acetylornithine deacetylase [Marinimicrobium sp. ABcell2]MDQ2076532.1 acetylornithine deacetylase [Marinimicrobium sp. ABcell2]
MTFNLGRYTEQLAALVAEPSVSCAVPEWDMGNQPVLDLLASWLEERGFSVEILPLPEQPGKANLIATRGTGPGGLVLSGHSDTVPYDENRWQSDPFKLTERDGKLYGLGATDMKGFFPAVLAAIDHFAEIPFQQPLIVLATADEESSMSGARALAELGRPKARYAVIGEPTELVPIHMHKGIMMEAVRVRGASGHSSDPSLGNNALETMHQVIGELLGLRQQWQERYRNPGFKVQVPTMNLGCIHGGDSPNRICAQCELHFDLRPLPGMDNDELRKTIQDRLTPLAERSGTDIVFSSLFHGVDSFEQSRDCDLIRTCEQLTGHTAESVAFATEAPFLQSLGMETVVLGPGSINQAHQPDEFIDTRQLAPAVDTLVGLIQKFCVNP